MKFRTSIVNRENQNTGNESWETGANQEWGSSCGFVELQPHVWRVSERKNVPFAKLASLRDANVEFYSLQKGAHAQAELTELTNKKWEGPRIVDFTNRAGRLCGYGGIDGQSGLDCYCRYVDLTLGWRRLENLSGF